MTDEANNVSEDEPAEATETPPTLLNLLMRRVVTTGRIAVKGAQQLEKLRWLSNTPAFEECVLELAAALRPIARPFSFAPGYQPDASDLIGIYCGIVLVRKALARLEDLLVTYVKLESPTLIRDEALDAAVERASRWDFELMTAFGAAVAYDCRSEGSAEEVKAAILNTLHDMGVTPVYPKGAAEDDSTD